MSREEHYRLLRNWGIRVLAGFVFAAQRDDWTVQLIGTAGALTILLV